MGSLRNNVDNISDGAKSYVNDYAKMLTLMLSEKSARFIGFFATFFIFAIIILVVIIFCSMALANFLNTIFLHDYWGYLIVSGGYLFLIIFLLTMMRKTTNHLITNSFLKIILMVMDVEIEQEPTLAGIKAEKEVLKHKMSAEKDKVGHSLQLLKYTFLESLFEEIVGLFRKKKEDS